MPQAIPLILTLTINAAQLATWQLIIANLAVAAISNMLVERPKDRDTTKNTRMSRTALRYRAIVYGQAKLSGPIIFAGGTGASGDVIGKGLDQGLSLIVALTGHPVEEIVSVFVGDKEHNIATEIADNYSVTDPEYKDYLKIFALDGQDPESVIAHDLKRLLTEHWKGDSAFADPAVSTNKLNAVAHVACIFKHAGNPWGAIPSVAVRVKGKRVRDPVAMYTAEQNLTDPLAVAYVYSNNWGACVLDYLMDPYNGMGIPLSEIDLLYFRNAALLSDELVVSGVTTTKRFTCDGVLSTGDAPIDNMEKLLSAGFGTLVYSQGKYKLFGGEYQVPLVGNDTIITESDIVGSLQVTPVVSRSNRFNAVRGTFTQLGEDVGDKSAKTAFTQKNFPEVSNATYKAADAGSDNYTDTALNGYIYKEIDLPLTNNEHVAQRLASILLNRARQAVSLQLSVRPDKAVRFTVGDNIKVTLPNLAIGVEVNTGFSPASFGAVVQSAGAITSVPISAGGAGYLFPPKITINTAAGTGAVLFPVVDAGTIQNIVVVSGGTGYLGTDTITIADPSQDSVGFIDKVFKVESWAPKEDGSVELSLREDSPDTYTENLTITMDDNPDVTVTTTSAGYTPQNLILDSGSGVSSSNEDGTWQPALRARFSAGLDPLNVSHYDIQRGKGNALSRNIVTLNVDATLEDPVSSGQYTAITNFTLESSVLTGELYAQQGHPGAVLEFNFNNNVGTINAPEYVDVKGTYSNIVTT